MGLYNFPSANDGVLPILVMNTIMSLKILKKLLGVFLELMGISTCVYEENTIISSELSNARSSKRVIRGICNIKFKHSNFALDDNLETLLLKNNNSSDQNVGVISECCVCLCKFEEDDVVSELHCKHFFHKNCLEKWFDKHHLSTCPLCRSTH